MANYSYLGGANMAAQATPLPRNKGGLHQDDAIELVDSCSDTKDYIKGLIASLGDRQEHFPPPVNRPRLTSLMSEEQRDIIKRSRQEYFQCFANLREFLQALHSMPHCLSIKNQGRRLLCKCNKYIPVPNSSDRSQVYLIQLTAFVYHFSTKDRSEQDRCFVRLIQGKSLVKDRRLFFRMTPYLPNIQFCKDTFCRMLGIQKTRYERCMKASTSSAFAYASILSGIVPRHRRKQRKSTVVNGNLANFFERVSTHGRIGITFVGGFSVRRLYECYLDDAAKVYNIDDEDCMRPRNFRGVPVPTCSLTKFRTCWASYKKTGGLFKTK